MGVDVSAANALRAPAEGQDQLSALRARIDEVDLGILRLIEQRGHIVEEILLLKQSVDLPVLDEARERQLLERLRARHRGPHDWQEVERVFRLLLEISRGLAR
jgi:3-deoxy-7-phosphoheptulonate synthase / chorismate mutase